MAKRISRRYLSGNSFAMRYRILGKTGWEVSAVSMGCWGIGGQWGPVDDQQALDTIAAALDSGVNLFDTADSYGLGRSEELLGKAFRGNKPDDVYIATKVGNWGRQLGDPPGLRSIYSIVNCCHASLYRLGLDAIDLYQCHVAKPETPEIFVEAFELLKQQGKIRHYAISTNDLDALKALNNNDQCASCQINYSILNRVAEKDILPYCRENNIGVLLRGPLAKGILSGKFTADTHFGDTVRQSWNEGQSKRAELLSGLEKVEKVKSLVTEQRSLVDIALQFTLAHTAVTCPIPGMKSPAQARQNANATDSDLTVNDLNFIDKIS